MSVQGLPSRQVDAPIDPAMLALAVAALALAWLLLRALGLLWDMATVAEHETARADDEAARADLMTRALVALVMDD